jgi:hypothetical protein
MICTTVMLHSTTSITVTLIECFTVVLRVSKISSMHVHKENITEL